MNHQEHFDKEAFQNVLKQYEQARRSGEEIYLDADVLTDIADYYDHHHQTKKAIETIDYAIRLFPDSVLPLAFRARMALMLEDSIDGAKHFLSLITDKDSLEYGCRGIDLHLLEPLL